MMAQLASHTVCVVVSRSPLSPVTITVLMSSFYLVVGILEVCITGRTALIAERPMHGGCTPAGASCHMAYEQGHPRSLEVTIPDK